LDSEDIPLYRDFAVPVLERLKSRKPAIVTAKSPLDNEFSVKEVLKEKWLNSEF